MTLNTLRVPTTLIRSPAARSFEPILYQPAMWNTPSTPAIGPRSESTSVMSPGRTSTRSETRSFARSGFLAIAMTSWPASTSCRVTRPPMKPVAPVTKYFAIASRWTKRRDLDNAAHRGDLTHRPESTLFKGNIGICHGSYASTLIGYEAVTTRRRCFHGGNAHPQTHPFSPRRRLDESRRRDRARDGPGAPPGCDRNARVARVRADGAGRRRDSTGDAVRRPQHPPDRIRECGRPPLPEERVRAVRRDLLRTGKRHQPLGPHGALRHPRGDDARLRLPHAACGSLRHARDRCGRLRGRERDGGRAVPAHDARSGPGQPHGQIQTVGEREGRNLGIVEPLRREVGEEQGSRVRGSRVEGVDRPFSGNDREYGNGARRDRFRVPGGRADEAVPYRPGPGEGLQVTRRRRRRPLRRHGRHRSRDARTADCMY